MIGFHTTGLSSSIVYWEGLIDDVALWNRSLSSSEVEGLYNSYEQQEGDVPEVSGSRSLIAVFLLIAVVAVFGIILTKKQ